ncbi:hypothetical protein GCM10009785_26690 [Brooklawnia cerclae]|uniref:HNH endonuclease n=1 Tax=Brooklawnia cerclae TaxID=349934 RepID=A0ABX0SKR2_9ACTN|nr:hypothetical protein [Brooklawnia cerclae]NIH57322.1 hypothetical protein [Brooklawnia cerclae]
MSLRRFLGWEQRTVTVERDGRTVTTAEPEYDDWERAIQIAYDDWRGDVCPDCGQPLSVSLLDREHPDGHRWVAGFQECRSCAALEEARHKQSETDEQRRKVFKGVFIPTGHRRWHVKRID